MATKETEKKKQEEAKQPEKQKAPEKTKAAGNTPVEPKPQPEVKEGEVVGKVPPPQAPVALPPPTQLEKTDKPGEDETLFEVMEYADEMQILDELKGRALDIMVYEFEQDGRKVTSLSYAGVSESVRTMNARGKARIRISPAYPPKIEENDSSIQVTVYAEDEKNGGGYFGVKRQPKKFEGGKNAGKPRVFPLEQALSKAQRNALKQLLPLAFITEMVKEFRAGNKVKTFTKVDVQRIKQEKSSPPPAQLPSVGKDYKITDSQLRMMFAKFGELKLSEEDIKKYFQTKYPDMKSRKDIMKSQLDEVLKEIDLLKEGKLSLTYSDDGSKLTFTKDETPNKTKPDETAKPKPV